MDFINFIDKNLDEMSRKMADMDDCPAETDGTRSLAMAYVPWQKWQALYEAEKGFCRGTIFAELDKPFEGTGGRLR